MFLSYFFLPNFTPGLFLSVELPPLSDRTRVGKGFPEGATLNRTLSPLFGPRVIVLVKVLPVLRLAPELFLAMPPVDFFAMINLINKKLF